MDGGLQTLDNNLTLHSVADCPNLLCEELENEETKNSQRCNKGLRKEGEVQQQILQQREDEEAAQEVAQGKEQELRGIKVLAAETEEKKMSLDTSQEVEDVQVDDRIENKQETEIHEEENDRKSSDKRDERRRNRKRKGRKQSEQERNRKHFKRFNEQQEENNRSQTQEMLAVSSGDSCALSEPPVPLMNSCELSDPVYMGCGVTGLCCPPVPMLYSSQPPVSMQPAPPQPPSSAPLLPPSLPQPGPEPLEVGTVCLLTFGEP